MKTQTPIFPPPSPHLYTTSVVFRWQPCLFIFPRIALLPCVSDNAQAYFFSPPYSPVFLILGTLIPACVYILLPCFFFTRTGTSVFTTRTLVLNLSRVSTTDIPPLVQPMHSPHPRPTISILILFHQVILVSWVY
jgi:hypothetical protein